MVRPEITWALLAVLLRCSLRVDAASLRHSTIQNKNEDIQNKSADYNLRLNNFNNVQYSAPMTVGGQTLPVIYDTGSFEILVLSKLCTSCEARHSVYDNAISSSFLATAPPVVTEHLFGSGSVVSEKGFETVRLGDQTSPLALEHMPFWQVLRHEIAVWDESAHFSGIVGLGHPDHIPEGFAAAGSERDILMLAAMRIKSFGICLQRSSSDAPGWLVFGPSVDNLPVGGFFRPIPIVGKTHWGVMMYDFHVPGIVKPDPCVPSCGAIIDSGTSLIAAPPAALPMIKQLSSMVKTDCSNLWQLPTLKFRLGDQLVELPPKAYVMRVKKKVMVKQDLWKDFFQPESVIETQCVPAFMTINKNSAYGPVWILGMPFLRYYYTVFDRFNKKVFISEATPGCQPSPPSAVPAFFNATHMVNTTHMASASGASGISTRFAKEDFEPNEVDPNEARLPLWASEPDNEKGFPF